VFVMVGTGHQAREAFGWGADGLIAQGCDAGGHIAGDTSALRFLPRARKAAGGRPVLLAGGIANADDTRAALGAGADGVVAGTRFLLTHEARAHPEYQRRILAADKTFRTTLFGLGWSAPRRGEYSGPAVVSRRRERQAGAAADQLSGVLAKLPERGQASVPRLQTRLPLFSPAAPTVGMPESAVEQMALYAGETVLRLTSVISAREAVAALTSG
jgi:nitronate monooxygenase